MDFDFPTPLTTWTMNHNLGYNPLVSLLNSGGTEVKATVQHTSINQTVVTFPVAQAGSAHLI